MRSKLKLQVVGNIILSAAKMINNVDFIKSGHILLDFIGKEYGKIKGDKNAGLCEVISGKSS